VETLDPNDDAVVAAVAELDQDLLVYSGPGGVILDAPVLTAGPRFLHCHAGRLPDYRGSTTVYYSLLDEGTCSVTAFIMTETLDGGPIVAQQTYPPPADPETLDLYYDPWIRAQLLADVLSEYRARGELDERPQRSDEGETYFIVHPVLKHLALLRE
jgi:methionyl-tRNA formyltransferase